MPSASDSSPVPNSGHDAPLKLEEFLPYRVNVLASLLSQALTRVYAQRYGIAIAEWRVLVTLGQFNVLTGKQIGSVSHMHKTKVSRAVAMLERRKLLTRRVNRQDLREALLSLTPEGRAVYQELAPHAATFAQQLLDVLDPDDRKALDRALTQLTARSSKLVRELARAPRDS